MRRWRGEGEGEKPTRKGHRHSQDERLVANVNFDLGGSVEVIGSGAKPAKPHPSKLVSHGRPKGDSPLSTHRSSLGETSSSRLLSNSTSSLGESHGSSHSVVYSWESFSQPVKMAARGGRAEAGEDRVAPLGEAPQNPSSPLDTSEEVNTFILDSLLLTLPPSFSPFLTPSLFFSLDHSKLPSLPPSLPLFLP